MTNSTLQLLLLLLLLLLLWSISSAQLHCLQELVYAHALKWFNALPIFTRVSQSVGRYILYVTVNLFVLYLSYVFHR